MQAKDFAKDLQKQISKDQVSNAAAALAYYFFLAIFPALILALTLIPYLPIPNVDQAIMDMLRQALPGEAAQLLTGEVQSIANQRRGGLLSFGVLATLWAASSGVYALMQGLNTAYGIKEKRSFIKGRAVALGLTLLLGAILLLSFGLIVLGGQIQSFLGQGLGWSQVLLILFAALRYVIVAVMLTLAALVAYKLGPRHTRKQSVKNLLPGSLFAMAAMVLATLGFRWYVSSFGNYSATYGSLGAVIVLMLWLYISGMVILIGAEINEVYRARKSQAQALEIVQTLKKKVG